MKLSYKLNITALFQRMNIKLKGRYSVFPLRTKATSINAPDSMKKADLIIENAKIFTADKDKPHAAALAVKDGSFVYVGDEA